MSLVERRQHLRVPCRAVVEVSAKSGWPFVECEARDVSAGGMCIRFSKELQLRSRVRVRLWQSEGQSIECDGTVNWTLGRGDVGTPSSPAYDIGIQFDALSKDVDEMLESLMEAFGQSSADRSVAAPGVDAFNAKPVTIRGERYTPELTPQPSTGDFQLLIHHGKEPYYSQRFGTVAEAQARWEAFKASMLRRAKHRDS